ncbi:PREDICTED: major royal jelly protein 1-like [Wasmannia auropunctata]|uniref:major royal jelly protein 1-like n=1 Tax=Wasmannia auropunctata TaxID=64793 RepID=UPI0005ED7641|nr:PREDICTED: major royal jelly protein 1-like [Wasmannia auropunctata]
MRHFLLVMLTLLMTATSFGKLLLEYQWKYLDLLWDSPQQKKDAIASGRYNASAAFFYDVDKALDGRVFITAVRDKGIPVSVLTVTEKQGEGGPLLRPYPDWSWYKDDCKGITGGVYQLEIKCNHMFFVDDGRIGDDQVCSPQLMIFDLSTDKLVKRITIPIDIAHNKTGTGLLSSVAVFAPHCRNVKNNAIVFMADVEGAGLIVHNGRTSKLCRVESDYMKPTEPDFVLANKRYSFGDTIYGLTLIGRDLYYAALAGSKIYKTAISNLIECSKKDINEANRETHLAGALGGQTAMIASDRCVLFFSDITKTSLMCADGTKEITSKNKELIVSDPKQLEFPSGLKIRNGELLVMSNRYQLHVINALDINEVNFRVLSMPITEVERDTKCYSSCNY